MSASSLLGATTTGTSPTRVSSIWGTTSTFPPRSCPPPSRGRPGRTKGQGPRHPLDPLARASLMRGARTGGHQEPTTRLAPPELAHPVQNSEEDLDVVVLPLHKLQVTFFFDHMLLNRKNKKHQ